MLCSALLFSACGVSSDDTTDRLNEKSYAWHYRSIDSTRSYAERALERARNIGYGEGEAEALNNLAFVAIFKMDYPHADSLLRRAVSVTDNQVELFVADIQLMRLCQRQSLNKDFYDYRERAQRRLRRIEEEERLLDDHQRRRMIYAFSEYQIVLSTYLYYMGQKGQSAEALYQIDPNGAIVQDTAQTLNLFYNIGAGGIITEGSAADISQQEFDYLLRCYLMSVQYGYPYWAANSMQAMSEHLQGDVNREQLIRNNLPAMKFINTDHVPDSLLAGNLAERARDIFRSYGDVYQTAGAWRTLAECYWDLHDYTSAIYCLDSALSADTLINRAPDLVASIREQLSLAWSALDNKEKSDYNRNIYLDMQERTRQDRQLEARAGQLDRSARQLNLMIGAVVVMILLVCFLLLFFAKMRRRSDSRFSPDRLLQPLRQWSERSHERAKVSEEHLEEIEEQTKAARTHVVLGKRRNLEQRAKVQLVNSITPFIDRIINELDRMEYGENQPERYEYIVELTDKINDYNAVLTRWIQLRQGQLSLHIESFPLQVLFDVVSKSRMAFGLKGVTLDVQSTTAIVKADKTLTLFMVNTLADNARKFTPRGGRVVVSAEEKPESIEISVTDNGVGMSEEQTAHLFDHKPIMDSTSADGLSVVKPASHGFGLMNCKGIIDKYRKTSRIFDVCEIRAESQLGKGSRFSFRLPKGIVRLLTALLVLMPSVMSGATAAENAALQARRYVDSCYQSNIRGTYERTLHFADSARQCLNRQYHILFPDSVWQMTSVAATDVIPAEIVWFRDSVPVDYRTILSMRNESAVAALALHRWDVYRYNNAVYTQLYREVTADNTIASYVRVMQKSETNKNVAVALLVILLLCVVPAWYVLYYRHVLYYRFCLDRITRINAILLGPLSEEKKIERIDSIWRSVTIASRGRMPQLDEIVRKVLEALRQNVNAERTSEKDIEMAEDELHRVQLENDKLHVSNNVLDNCLSALKHETMYYPSRIRQLIDDGKSGLQPIREVVAYYKELYAILSAQAMRAVIRQTRLDFDMLDYLQELLVKNGCKSVPTKEVSPAGKAYVTLRFRLERLSLTKDQVLQLFTPMTSNLQFLLCRQILREVGDVTNLRASGIEAESNDDGTAEVIVTMPEKVFELWKSSKLSSLRMYHSSSKERSAS